MVRWRGACLWNWQMFATPLLLHAAGRAGQRLRSWAKLE